MNQELAFKHMYISVSLLPQDIHGPEDREMLARLAASTEDDQSADSEAAIEKYLRSVLAVENVLTLDRLRQVRKHYLHTHTHTQCILYVCLYECLYETANHLIFSIICLIFQT